MSQLKSSLQSHPTSSSTSLSTKERILDCARALVRNRGYNGFSYADISSAVGIRKSSIHYHFPTKEALVISLIQDYHTDMERACDRISRSGEPPSQQLQQFRILYRDSLASDRICMCAMMASDYAVLPTSVKLEVNLFFQTVKDWLTELLITGIETQGWDCSSSPETEANGLVALMQGAQLLARAEDDATAAFDRIVSPLLAGRFGSQCST